MPIIPNNKGKTTKPPLKKVFNKIAARICCSEIKNDNLVSFILNFVIKQLCLLFLCLCLQTKTVRAFKPPVIVPSSPESEEDTVPQGANAANTNSGAISQLASRVNVMQETFEQIRMFQKFLFMNLSDSLTFQINFFS